MTPRGGLTRIIHNLAHLLGGKAAAGVISLVYLAIVTRSLGVERYGILVLLNTYAVLVGSVVAFSGFHGLVRYGAQALETGDHPRLLRLVRFMAAVELACGALAVAVAALLAPVVGPHLGWSHEAMALALPYSFAVLGTVRATPQGLLQIAGRFDLIGAHQTISPLVRLAGALIAWWAGAGLPGFIGAWLAAAIAEGLSMWLLGAWAWRRMGVEGRLLGRWSGVRGENDDIVRFMLTTNVDITLRELAPNLAPLTVGWLLSPAAAGLFALALRVTSVLQQPAQMIGQASYAVYATLAAAGDRAGLAATTWRSASLGMIAALPVLAILTLFGRPILILIAGPTFAAGYGLTLLIAVARTLGLGAAPLGAALTAIGRPSLSVSVAVVTNLLLYPLLPLLLIRIGIGGAGWHAMIQSAVATAALAWLFARTSGIHRSP